MQIPNQNVDIFTSSDKRSHVTVKSKYAFQKALKSRNLLSSHNNKNSLLRKTLSIHDANVQLMCLPVTVASTVSPSGPTVHVIVGSRATLLLRGPEARGGV